jgi:endonuclease/exonuclease/phosphatase (EEP) superfamily protein YafD
MMGDQTTFQAAHAAAADGSKLETNCRGHKLGKATRILGWVCWVYLGLLLSLWALLYLAADRWWPGTLLLFGPRWLCLVPALVLIPAAAWFRPRLLLGRIPLGLFVALVPITGLCIPWRPQFARSSSEPPMRVLTCNLHEAKEKDTEALGRLISETNPAIVALQNWHARYQKPIFADEPWHARREGQLYVASRYPITDVELFRHPSITQAAVAARYELQTPIGALQLLNLHLTTPREGLASVLARDRAGPERIESNAQARWRESAAVRTWADQVVGPILVVGDFNLPMESLIYREFWNDYTDAFSTAGLGWGFTFRTRHSGVRIDHILGSPGWRCRRCWVGPDVGSLHRPVIADMEWVDASR